MRRIIMCMTLPILEPAAVAAELRRANSNIDVDTYLAILGRATRTTATVSAEAADLLLEAGVDPKLFSAAGINESRAYLASAVENSNQAALDGTITTTQAAILLNTPASNIRRSILSRQIYSAGRFGREGHRIPVWQFVDGRRLPHLSDILDALPTDLHPLEVTDFFTTARAVLNGMTPAQWLSSGGDAQAVIGIADEEGWA